MSPKARGLKELARSKKPKRSPYDRVLIVCEGKKTEPHYFEALRSDLKLSTTNVKVDGNSESSPRSVIEYAKKLYKEDSKINGSDDCYDRVYCVFDKDSHSTYQEAINTIQTANPKNVFYAVTSVPCFEFWILLHFEHTTQPFGRTQSNSPCDNVIHKLKVHLPNYEKGDRTIYEQLKASGKLDVGMTHAKQVNLAASKSMSDNPSTSIPELIEYLRGLGK